MEQIDPGTGEDENPKECGGTVDIAPEGEDSPFDITAKITSAHFLNGGDIANAAGGDDRHPLNQITVCLATLRSGYVVVGTSRTDPSSGFGQTAAYNDMIRQLWLLEEYANCEIMATEVSVDG